MALKWDRPFPKGRHENICTRKILYTDNTFSPQTLITRILLVSAFQNALSDPLTQGVLLVMLEDPPPWVQWPPRGLPQGSLRLGDGTWAAGLSRPVLWLVFAPCALC